jgi:hypothetical protein
VVETRGKLKNEPAHRGIVLLEQGVPSRLLSKKAALNQGAFCGTIHRQLLSDVSIHQMSLFP